MKYLIGIDIGTQGTKTAMFDTAGNLVADSFEASNLINPAPGTVMQEPQQIFESVLNTIKTVMEKTHIDNKKVAAIAFDGQMAGIMGIDEDFNHVTYYDSWLDTRCEDYIRQIKETCREKVVAVTGSPVTYAHGPKILWWKNESPEAYARTKKFVMAHVYVAGKLCGLKAKDAYIDYTGIHFTGYADNQKKEWSDELLGIFDIDKEKMPEIVCPWHKAGNIKKEYAVLCGLAEGTPVIAGCGDSAAASLGAGIVRPGQVFDVAGTASVFSCCVDTYSPDIKGEALLQMRSVIDGYWQPLAYINGGGLCLRWFRDNVSHSDYNILESESKKLKPGSEGLIFNPHFSGRACPNNPNVKGSFIGLNWSHTRAHMYRAIMEGIAYEYRYYFDAIKSKVIDFSFEDVYVLGGGAKSPLFNQVKADVLGVKYNVLENNDTAALGSAVIAGFGVGIYNDIADSILEMVNTKEHFNPEYRNYELYTNYYNVYLQQFSAMDGMYSEIKRIYQKKR